MGKTERLMAAAAIAFALSAEAGCTDDGGAQTKTQCTVVDPIHGRMRHVSVDPRATCPPAGTSHTTAHGATYSSAGWYYVRGRPYYGILPAKRARAATPQEAEHLQSHEESLEHAASRSNASSEEASRSGSAHEAGEGSFGEAGAHGGSGG